MGRWGERRVDQTYEMNTFLYYERWTSVDVVTIRDKLEQLRDISNFVSKKLSDPIGLQLLQVHIFYSLLNLLNNKI